MPIKIVVKANGEEVRKYYVEKDVAEMEVPRWVVNNTGEKVVVKFNGQDYEFLPGVQNARPFEVTLADHFVKHSEMNGEIRLAALDYNPVVEGEEPEAPQENAEEGDEGEKEESTAPTTLTPEAVKGMEWNALRALAREMGVKPHNKANRQDLEAGILALLKV